MLSHLPPMAAPVPRVRARVRLLDLHEGRGRRRGEAHETHHDDQEAQFEGARHPAEGQGGRSDGDGVIPSAWPWGGRHDDDDDDDKWGDGGGR